MEAISAAAAVLAIGQVGAHISIKLIAFANQISTASDRVRAIASDVSLTANVLQQLSELMNKQDEVRSISVFSNDALATTQASADACKKVFHQLEEVLKKASQQLRADGNNVALGKKPQLSRMETMIWPFFEPSVDGLQTIMRDARGTLMLILQVTTLGYLKRQAELNNPSVLSVDETSQLASAILASQRQKAAAKSDIVKAEAAESPSSQPMVNTKFKGSDMNLVGVDAEAGQARERHSSIPSTHNTSPIVLQPADVRSVENTKLDPAPTPGSTRGVLIQAQYMDTRESLAQIGKSSFPAALPSRPKTASIKPGSFITNDQLPSHTKHVLSDNPNLQQDRLDRAPHQECWIVTPVMSESEIERGYDLRWWRWTALTNSAKLNTPQRRIRRLFQWRSDDPLRQTARMTHMERKVVDDWVESDEDVIQVTRITFLKMKPPREPITQMPWRAIEVIVERKSRTPKTHQVRRDHSDASSIQVSRSFDDLAAERRRIQDRLATRNYRRKVKRRDPKGPTSDSTSSDVNIMERPSRRPKSTSPSLDSETQRPLQKMHMLASTERKVELRERDEHRTSLKDSRSSEDDLKIEDDTREISPLWFFGRPPKAKPSSLGLATPAGEKNVEDYQPEAGAEGELDEPSTAESQKIIDDLLRKYTTIYD
ncbi:MAG: hypothetical protein Q9209_004502 [Squamulea sp. 1 TL-2023]